MMMTKGKTIVKKCQLWVILYLIVGLVNCVECQNDTNRKLIRRKRYLTFPEGSSLQVIYDQTIPTVALPLVFTVGVTVAIAYELPSKPFSELAEDFRNKFKVLKNDNTSKSDNIKHITYTSNIDWKKLYKSENKHNLYYLDKPQLPSSVQYEIRRKDPPQIYYENNRPNPWITSDKFNYYFSGNRNNYGNEDKKFNYIKMLANQYAAASIPKNTKKENINRSFSRKLPHRKHLIQPVFGKRSIKDDDDDDDEAELHKIYHISTRQQLYGSIERYLEDKGLSGRGCVLKSLCESRNNKDLPNTFIGAILKSIFRLPKLNLVGENDIRDYMKAHHEVNDCTETYSICKSSFWASEFVK